MSQTSPNGLRRPSASASSVGGMAAPVSPGLKGSQGDVRLSPQARPTPSSRMALSSLVNSPPQHAHHALATSARSTPREQYPSPSRSTRLSPQDPYARSLPHSPYAYPQTHSNPHSQPRSASHRYVSPPHTGATRDSMGREVYLDSPAEFAWPGAAARASPRDASSSRRASRHSAGRAYDGSPIKSTSRSLHDEPNLPGYKNGSINGYGGANGGGVPDQDLMHHMLGESSRGAKQMIPVGVLQGSESIWEEALGRYQTQREREVDEILYLYQHDYKHRPSTTRIHPPPDDGTRQDIIGDDLLTNGSAGPSKKKKPSRRSAARKVEPAGLEDELLGLAEGAATPSLLGASSPPQSEMMEGIEDEHVGPDTIVLPSGLTRGEIIAKITENDMSGLTEDDVKAVQDEMWLRAKDASGAASSSNMIRKDGTLRRKPGPAKGWKKLRGEAVGSGSGGRRGSSIKDADSEAGDTSIAGDTVNGDADADIAALLGDEPRKLNKKKRPARDDDEEGSRIGGSDEDSSSDSMGEDELDAVRLKISKNKVLALKHKAAKAARREKEDDGDSIAGPDVLQDTGKAVEDPRGISEAEAKSRFDMVEDLQKVVWATIVRDIPKMYRVYQALDLALKQDALRKVQAVVRNGFAQRAAKPTYKSAARINKETITKSRRVVKEMLLYWRKNEKDELAARKKAEKEALDRAKAEEEAREAKRQSRKLNFLLTQTELYSHFIGKKIKTKEAEGVEGEDVGTAPGTTDADGERDELMRREAEANEEIALDENGKPIADIDYDDDDEENLRRHAARGAHAAVQAARKKAQAFDEARAGSQKQQEEVLDLDGDELNFQNPTLAEDSVTITQPKLLMAQLKEYQLKGLTWLGNLYEQGINGILADEMGLGKTIQSISLLAYLAEHHNLWGPFLIIAPSSTLHNWQQELARFVPRLKALPYWGSPKDRETLRKIWSRKNMTFTEDSPFHVLVTSYQLAVQDEKYFHSTRWQYMILDEAQAIKSSSSARWKSLLSMHCRNRLLLTGTPIQNSMQELWALLHFIMPSLFDSHEEFSEWFSKDIENAAASGGNSSLQPEQLRRLHMILKPFMLRRVKKHVQKELGDKIEIDLLVDLSQRQRSIYKALRQRVSISDLIAQANNLTDTAGAKNLMNLVMQFRKVCNHPDLFERADVVSPFMFGTFSHSGNLARETDQLYCPDSAKNAIEVNLPRLIWTDGGKLDVPSEQGLSGSDTKVLGTLMNIWQSDWINESLKKDDGGFGFSKMLDLSAGQVAKRAKGHPLASLIKGAEDLADEEETVVAAGDLSESVASRFTVGPITPALPSTSLAPGLTQLTDITNTTWSNSYFSRRDARFAIEPAVTTYIKPNISNRSYLNTETRHSSDPIITKALYGTTPSESDDPTTLSYLSQTVPSLERNPNGLIASSDGQVPWSSLRIPPPKRLIVDSAKLARLDDLLRELKDGGHRVLLYFQMTKMMDLVEEYLIYRQYKYLRLDGSSPIGERRDMVTSFQTNPDFFIFCLSTRAGGLGINLTAADTVIFYDHDWNPSNDAQAMDRAHRVGQTKQVTVYRLIARGTIEERIVKLARAKKDVQDIVVGTKSLTDVAKPSEIVSLFMDDEELAESVAKRKQAEAHGYVVPTSIAPKPRSKFGDGLGIQDDDEDDFFSLTKKPANNEDEDFGDEGQPGGGGGGNGGSKDTKKSKKRKVSEAGDTPKRSHKKKVKIAVGPDGLPI